VGARYAVPLLAASLESVFAGIAKSVRSYSGRRDVENAKREKAARHGFRNEREPDAFCSRSYRSPGFALSASLRPVFNGLDLGGIRW